MRRAEGRRRTGAGPGWGRVLPWPSSHLHIFRTVFACFVTFFLHMFHICGTYNVFSWILAWTPPLEKCDKHPKKVSEASVEKSANEGGAGKQVSRRSAGGLEKRAIPVPGLKNQPFCLQPYLDSIVFT